MTPATELSSLSTPSSPQSYSELNAQEKEIFSRIRDRLHNGDNSLLFQ